MCMEKCPENTVSTENGCLYICPEGQTVQNGSCIESCKNNFSLL